ncbi:hypothetical protein [Pseudomonas sp. UBA4194]|jgi:hypothetical protein|uniref:hypothetical protein n=1 Tax=Pseudomonas sp. UBA4194 TaxID=1947317 RepID=UPI0025DD2925|nr:hypothetical protein [Pseudomonas sp. UBA4194]
MKEWKISFVNKDGVLDSMTISAENCPTIEDAAKLVRSKLYPVAAELDDVTLPDKVASPAVKSLKSQHSVEITAITEVA